MVLISDLQCSVGNGLVIPCWMLSSTTLSSDGELPHFSGRSSVILPLAEASPVVGWLSAAALPAQHGHGRLSLLESWCYPHAPFGISSWCWIRFDDEWCLSCTVPAHCESLEVLESSKMSPALISGPDRSGLCHQRQREPVTGLG